MKRLYQAAFAMLAFAMTSAHVEAAATCQGKFPNPITDICWDCTFPMRLGGQSIKTMNQEDNASSAGMNVACACASPPMVGVTVSFWEPARIAEASTTTYCFHALGGLKIDAGIDAPSHTQSRKRDGQANQSFYQMHWYIAPLMFWLEVLYDDDCLEKGAYDLAYFTEIDAMWADSTWTFVLNPDAALFANPAAQAVCAADCISTVLGFPMNSLYWCAGCWGSMYPLTGWVGAHMGGVQASSLLTARFTNKLHREGLMWAASGEQGSCWYYPQLLMAKDNYKMQLIYPTPQNKTVGKCCQPYGRSSIVWGAGKEVPYVGEDFAYQIFRKRDCCQSYKYRYGS